MYTQHLFDLFSRDLIRLKKEVEAFQNEDNLWRTPQGISNSAGNLTRHLIGNLNHFIGATLGETGYVRDRKSEFGDQGIPREEIIRNLEATHQMLVEMLPKIDPNQLENPYPLDLSRSFKPEMESSYFLIHLYGHLNYHLGQINYLRRILE